ncbi:ATP-dependent zinc metalloprotease FtsH [Candidatus Dojkabacteria bacterium]|nr:ATP-dependent zinc metalloprotease FtsH [Candidatus Dojkabacteria bacterium]
MNVNVSKEDSSKASGGKTSGKQQNNSGKNGGNKMPDIRKLPSVVGKKRLGVIISIILSIVILGIWLVSVFVDFKGEQVPLSEVVSDVKEGNYENVIERNGYVILEQVDTIKVGAVEKEAKSRKYALIKNAGDQSFESMMAERGIVLESYEYRPNAEFGLGDLIWSGILIAGVVLLFMLVKNMQSSGGKILEFGQSKARLIFGKKVKTTFDDVAGIDDSKEELVEVVDFLKNPKKYFEAGARIPKGVLLVGAPGTGKTLLAKAVAGEAGVPFFHTSGSEFEEMLVGAGASRVRDLFKKAKRATPCIIFIDEVDAIAKKRGTVLHSGNTEQTLNQLLVEMDGLEDRNNIIILAATNRPDTLDPAILRPGRFDRTVVVQMPDYEGRKEIMKVHSKGKKFGDDVDLDLIAKKTIGYSGADLENLLNEAAIMSAKDNRKVIKQEDLLESYLKVKLGRQKKNKRTEDDIKRVAYHEAGHAIVAQFTKGADPVEQVSIIPRGYTGGVTVFVPKEDSSFTTRTQMLAQIQHATGGYLAEEMFLEDVSGGASEDIKSATEVAKKMVKKFGMSKKLGFVRFSDEEESSYLGYKYDSGHGYSEETAKIIDEEVRMIIGSVLDEARSILERNRDKVEALVAALLANEVVLKDELNEIIG